MKKAVEPPALDAPAPSDDATRWLGDLQAMSAHELATGVELPSQSLGFTLSTTGYAISRRFREVLEPLGVHPREFAVLQAVARTEGGTQQAIAERVGVPASRMVALVDSLETRGLLERRQNRDDRRARALHLTPHGRELLGQAFAVAVEQEQRLTSDLTDDEREQLLHLLARVGVHVGVPPGVHPGMAHAGLADELAN
jgi:DNA-binding MarR family transcriptional regulator